MAKKGMLNLLVQSLTKSEKRYFKLTIAFEKKNNYLRLFDFIDKQGACTDQVIKAYFKNEVFVKQLHVTKNYLNQMILKSLRAYHAHISKGAELKTLLNDIEILFMKGLYDQCEALLEKGLALAQKYEKQIDLLSLYAWKRRLLLERSGDKERDQVNEVIREEKSNLEKMLTLNTYWEIMFHLFDPTSPEMEGRENHADFGDHPLLQSPERADTLKARVLYHHILYARRTMENHFPEAIDQLDKLIAHLETCPHSIQEDPASYVTALSNKVGLCLWMKDLKAVPVLLEKIRAMPKKYGLPTQAAFTIRLLLRTYNVELEMYRDSRRWPEGVALAEQAADFMKGQKTRIPDDYRLLLYYQFAYVYFMDKKDAKALFWLNEIFRYSFGETREDIQSFAHLLYLIIHFELGNEKWTPKKRQWRK